MKPHPNQERMLARHGWRLEDDPQTGGELRAHLDTISVPVAYALQCCRKADARAKRLRYRKAHRDRVNAYARAWRATNRERARQIARSSKHRDKQREAADPVHHS